MQTLFRITTANAEAVLGRALRPGEASSIAKTLEVLMSEAVELIEAHDELTEGI